MELQAPNSKRKNNNSKLTAYLTNAVFTISYPHSPMGYTGIQQNNKRLYMVDKPSKIKYTTLIAPIAQGGLQLQDLQTKIDANK